MLTYSTLITVEELATQLNNPNLCIIDCRYTLFDTEKGRKDYQEAHIPGASFAHLDEDLSGEIIPGQTGRHPLPSVEAISELFSSWGIDESVQVVAYDSGNGAIASRLWWMLRWLGHDKVAVLDGGWAAWQAAGQPQTAELPRPQERSFKAAPRPDWLVDAAQVNQLRLDADYRLIDARASERYEGKEEPIDPVAGHIPGALSAPYAENLAANGQMRSKEELQARFESVLGTVPVEQTIVYCGSGVTACHNLLAMQHAGMGAAKLYAGSWSDWITDKEREVGKK